MIRALWRWLTRQPPAPVTTAAYDPKADPIVRHFRREKLQAQRAAQQIERRRRQNFIERIVEEGRHGSR